MSFHTDQGFKLDVIIPCKIRWPTDHRTSLSSPQTRKRALRYRIGIVTDLKKIVYVRADDMGEMEERTSIGLFKKVWKTGFFWAVEFSISDGDNSVEDALPPSSILSHRILMDRWKLHVSDKAFKLSYHRSCLAWVNRWACARGATAVVASARMIATTKNFIAGNDRSVVWLVFWWYQRSK